MAEKGRRPAMVDKKAWRELQKHAYSFDELLDYYGATYELYRRIVATRPDAIIAPLRGAFPLVKTIQFFASVERQSNMIPKIYYPRTGELAKPTGKRIFDRQIPDYAPAMSETRKLNELRFILEKISQGKKKGSAVVLLLDESYGGGSISNTFSLLERAIREKKLNVRLSAVAVASQEREKCVAYTQLVSQKKIIEYPVKRLFTIDNLSFIHPIIERAISEPRIEGLRGEKEKIPKRMLRMMRSIFGDFAAKRPSLGVSRKALHGRLDLLEDLQELHAGKSCTRTSRLPQFKQKRIKIRRKNIKIRRHR